jgi:hypothetical protein
LVPVVDSADGGADADEVELARAEVRNVRHHERGPFVGPGELHHRQDARGNERLERSPELRQESLACQIEAILRAKQPLTRTKARRRKAGYFSTGGS